MSASPVALRVEPHPLLRLAAFETRFPARLGELPTPARLAEGLRADAPAPAASSEAPAPAPPDDDVRRRVRDLLRHGGYKPTGRGKPASEYLARAAAEGTLAPINPAVDACNVASLRSGLPISVVDLRLVRPPLAVRIAAAGERYVFNAAGQEIDVGGLLCLHDAAGPCANAVKDAQRTKTTPATARTLSLVWGCVGLEERLERAVRWYRALLERAGAETTAV